MSIMIFGTPCSLCGNPMLKGQKIKMLPPFIANEADPLWRFSDGSFHEECLLLDPLGGEIDRRVAEVVERTNPSKRQCLICGQVIDDPDDYFSLGHLTGNSESPIYKFNFGRFHLSHLHLWSELSSVCAFAEEQIKSGAWRGRGMEFIVEVLKSAKKRRAPVC